MGREIRDGAGMHSSIALLQERFRQVQRVKEMREERELLKMLSAADHQPKHYFNSNSSNPTMNHHHEPTRLFFHPEMMMTTTIPSRSPPSPHNNVSLSLWPTSHDDLEHNNNISIFGTPVSTNTLRPKDTSQTTRKQSLQASWKNIPHNWDSDSDSDSPGVDTTLHL